MENDSRHARLTTARELLPERSPSRVAMRLPDGYETGVYVYLPPGGVSRAPVVYLHGIQSHPGWFVGSAAALAERGHAVFQPVRRGSGDNQAGRGHADSAGQLLADVGSCCRFAAQRTGAERVHLVGGSWGGKLAAAYAVSRRRTVDIASLCLVVPGIAARVDVPRITRLAIGLSLLIAPRRQFDIPLNEPELFTRNEPMLQYLRNDPHRLLRATAKFLFVSRRLDAALRRAPAGALGAPTTLILAERDQIIDNAAARAAVLRLAGESLAVVHLPGCHTLEFEPQPQPLFDALAAGIDRGERAAT